MRIWQALSRHRIAGCDAKLRVAIEVIANVRNRSYRVELVAGECIRSVEARKAAEVIEFAQCSAYRYFVSIRVQIARLTGVVEHRSERVTTRCADSDNARARIRPVERRVRSAVDLHASNARRAHRAEVKCSTNIVRRNSVYQNEVCSRIAAAHEQGRDPAALAGLHQHRTKCLPHLVQHIDPCCESLPGDHTYGSGQLCGGSRKSCGRD